VLLIMADDPHRSYRQACADAGVSYRTAYRHLGKLGRPGSGRHRDRVITDEQMIAALRRADAELGRKATSTDFHRGREVGHAVFFRRYGSWDAAREAAGLEPIRWRARGKRKARA
jgi:hypothetical protein